MFRTWMQRSWGRWLGLGWPALAGSFLLCAVGAYILWLSWGRWPDVLVDFGRELYIPWQLSEGKVLYKDIFFYYGPFSKYFYAFFFKIFSPSLNVVVIINFCILIVFAFLLHRLLRFWASSAAALLSVSLFFTLFAFAQYTGIGNYNFVCPYAHELVHGLVLSVITLILFLKSFNNTIKHPWLMIGILMGLVFLTKVEVFVALSAALLIGGVTGISFLHKNERPQSWNIWLLITGFLLPVSFSFAYFISQMGLKMATTAFIFPYSAIFNKNLSGNVFYKGLSGWDNPVTSLQQMMTSAFGTCAVLVSIMLLSFLLMRIKQTWLRMSMSIMTFMAVALGIWFIVTHYLPAYAIFRSLPLFSVILLLWGGLLMFRHKKSTLSFRALALFVFSLFATLLLLKIFLYGHIFHSGFVLALPAVFLIFCFVFDEGSSWIERFHGSRTLFQALFIMILTGVVFSYGLIDQVYYSHKNFVFGSSKGKILTYDAGVSSTGPVMLQVLTFLETLPANATIAVLPEGVMLNFMSGRAASTKFFEFSPSFFNMVSESDVLSSFISSPADYIVLVDRDMSEHGARYFGKDYAINLYTWLSHNYETVQVIGNVPFTGKGFGVLIARKIMLKSYP
ncbi:MAG: hypothetical protein V2A70_09225 [Candidatus Omnitrophota bacterium]